MIGTLHGGSLGALGEVGSEAEPALRILHHADEVPPSLERLLRRVLGPDAPNKFLVQVGLHLPTLAAPQCPRLMCATPP